MLKAGEELKQLAVKAMEGDAEAAAEISSRDVVQWVDAVKKNSKVVAVLLKGK